MQEQIYGRPPTQKCDFKICYIFSEHLYLRTPFGSCFCVQLTNLLFPINRNVSLRKILTQMNGTYVKSNVELLETYASLSLRKGFKMRIMIFWPKLNLSIEQEMCFKIIAWFETCGYLDIPIPFFVWNHGLVVKALDFQSSPGVFGSN